MFIINNNIGYLNKKNIQIKTDKIKNYIRYISCKINKNISIISIILDIADIYHWFLYGITITGYKNYDLIHCEERINFIKDSANNILIFDNFGNKIKPNVNLMIKSEKKCIDETISRILKIYG